MGKSNPAFPSHLFNTIQPRLVSVTKLQATQYRLDAAAFLSEHLLTSLIPTSAKTTPLSQLADVFTVYIQSPVLAYVAPFKHSRPYMTTSELAEYQSGRTTHVSLLADPRLLGWEIKQGNIVVSRSGRVGEAYWVDKKLDGVLVGDSFRVVPKNPNDAYFLYAVLASEFAKTFLSGSAYGSVIDHASLDQLRTFRLPPVSVTSRTQITARIGDAFAAREEAYDLLDSAQHNILLSNSLPPLAHNPSPQQTIGAQQISASEVLKQEGGSSEFRLEAHFHNPAARTAAANIHKSPSGKKTVGQLSHEVIMGGRFKRNYVEADYGTRFLSGKNIIQIRLTDLKHLANVEGEMLAGSMLRRGWILVTRSGTIGRTSFVWCNFEDFAASEHILRIIPGKDQVDPGYLYAFLASPYGYEQILRFRHGSVIDEITDRQLSKVIVPLPHPAKQTDIGDKVRLAYEKRAKALKLEAQAQEILLREIKGKTTKEI
jgi:type I restriction enzyme S subunit